MKNVERGFSNVGLERAETIEEAKNTLFTRRDEERFRELELVRRATAFKGGLRKTAEGETQDWRLPFSDYLADAIFEDSISREALRDPTPGFLSKVDEAHFTPFGRALDALLSKPETVFVDLGCGGEQSRVPKNLAALYARNYIGVDHHEGFEEKIERVMGKEEAVRAYIKDDILLFLAKIEKLDNAIFYLSGVELSRFDRLRETSQVYAQACLKEIERLHGTLVVGPATFFFDPREYGLQFREVASHETSGDVGTGGTLRHTMYELAGSEK